MNNDLAPVVVFTYSRLEHLKLTIDALRQNEGAQRTVLYIVSDGAAIEEHLPQVRKVRDYIDDISGFREVVKVFRDKNLGPGVSPLLAENRIVNDHGSVISMEDDNITSTNFLSYMNQGLEFFKDNDRVYSISGYLPRLRDENLGRDADFFYYPWSVSWGYAVSKEKYNRFHPLKNKFLEQKRSGILTKQNKAGGLYVTDSLRRHFKQQKPLLDAVLATNVFAEGMVTVLPTVSKVQNIGQDGSGQSSKFQTSKFDVNLDLSGKQIFNFSNPPSNSMDLVHKLSNFHNGSAATRILRRLCLYHHSELMRNWLRGL